MKNEKLTMTGSPPGTQGDDPRRIIVALDFPTAAAAIALVERLDPEVCRLKVGKELFTRSGPALVEQLVGKGFDVFLDLKFHDIPNTVAKACEAAAELGVWMLNVHALGGRKMMEAAREAISKGEQPPLLIAVTILTSMDEQDLADIGLNGSAQANAVQLARLASASGMDGVVCSAVEVTQMRQALGAEFCLVTPGIRPQGVDSNDQKRVMTPAEAIKAGASFLVIGRPITAATDPLAALHAIQAEIAGVVV